ncbi:MAG: hypothetical protein K8U57_27685 [Planctomycetes bacterium]|nr:hypothetical protein [Planctomycetota bacterium]
MSGDTLKLLQQAVRKRGGHLSAISPSAEDLCGIIDHWNRLHWEDRNRLTEENKQLRTRVERLERKASGTEPE